MSKTINSGGYIKQLIKLCWYGSLYTLSPSKRAAQFKTFMISNDQELCTKIVRLHGNKISDLFHYFINPRIKIHQKIYIPFDYEELTVEGLNKSLRDFELRRNQYLCDEEYQFSKKKIASEAFKAPNKLNFDPKHENFSWRKQKGMKLLRIISPFNINFIQNSSTPQNNLMEIDAILVHIHGGGFI